MENRMLSYNLNAANCDDEMKATITKKMDL
jgi:hypothetical protein